MCFNQVISICVSVPVLNISFSLKSSFSNDCLPVAEINSMTMIFFVKKSIHGHFFLCFWLFNVIFLPMTGFEQRTPGVGATDLPTEPQPRPFL